MTLRIGMAALCGLGVLALAGEASAAAPKVRFGGDPSATRVVVELDRETTGKIAPGNDAKLISLDLAKVQAPADLSGDGQGLVKTWRLVKMSGGSRLKLDLASGATVDRRFLLPPGDGVAAWRYVIDLKSTGKGAPAASAKAPAPYLQKLAPPPITKKVIVVDAGHGGKDPGAAGETTHEKDITLAAAQALKARLEKTGRYRVVMTRDSDMFVPLDERVQIARRAGADLFISLHADSGSDPDVRGASAYTLSEKGAGRAQRVLGPEDRLINASLPASDRAVSQILLDLTQRATQNRSAVFAEMLLDKVSLQTQLLPRSHRDAGFVVLLAPDVPAVLLEMGFITSPRDETLLSSSGSRERLMGEVANAIDGYFDQTVRLASR